MNCFGCQKTLENIDPGYADDAPNKGIRFSGYGGYGSIFDLMSGEFVIFLCDPCVVERSRKGEIFWQEPTPVITQPRPPMVVFDPEVYCLAEEERNE